MSVELVNTLTHDKHDPLIYGFCCYIYHNENGECVVAHNGLEFATQRDLKLLLALADEEIKK